MMKLGNNTKYWIYHTIRERYGMSSGEYENMIRFIENYDPGLRTEVVFDLMWMFPDRIRATHTWVLRLNESDNVWIEPGENRY